MKKLLQRYIFTFVPVLWMLFYSQAEAVLTINEELGRRLAEAERLGEIGQVQDSLMLMVVVEELKKTKAAAEVIIQFRKQLTITRFCRMNIAL
jgi:hypothetical protein